MGQVNFYLKKAEEGTGKSLIYLKYKYKGNVLVWTFGQTIAPKHWNDKKQRVKYTPTTQASGDYAINDTLDALTEVLENAYKTELVNGLPTVATLRKHLNAYWNKNTKNDTTPTFKKLLDRFISGEIKHKGKERASNTLKAYTTLKSHIEEYETLKKIVVDYDTIDLDFLYKYITFLRGKKNELKPDVKGIGDNSIAKDIRTIKTILKKAVALGESKNVWYEHEEFKVDWAETHAVYLSTDEIIKLYRHNFKGNTRLEQVRDLFVFGCFVGLRFSDFSDVKPENIVEAEGERWIKMLTSKTKELVIIPCNPIVLEIFDKYRHNPNNLPPSLSNQKFNDYIKEVCKEAKLKEKGRLATDPTKELWECISSHTARRSFATNLYLQDFPVMDIMKITGHKTEKAFKGYIKLSKQDAAKRLSAHNKKIWSKMLLHVA